MSSKAPKIEVRALARTDWPAIETLFGERGACGGCWCMAWRRPRSEWEEHKGASNKRAFKKLVTSGAANGVLAFEDGEPVGWCSVGPRSRFRSLETKPSLATEWDENTWSVTCFFIIKSARGRSIGARLLEAAVRVAREHGARRVEGYPAVPPADGGNRLPGAFVWTGVPRMFERCRFRAVANPPRKRPIYIRTLRPGAARVAKGR